MRENPMEWRSLLELIERDAQPARIAKELPGMIEWAGGGEDDGIGAMIGFEGHFLLETLGLAAAYVLPPEDPTTALATVADRLEHLDFETGLEQLPQAQQRLVRKFVQEAKPAYATFGKVMQAVLGAYARNEYDLTADPNALILEAERAMSTDPQTAMALVGRVGAMGLRGKRWWWRWHKEIRQPLSGWIGLALNLVEGNSDVEQPLGPIEEERAHWHAVMAKEHKAPLPGPRKQTKAERKLDELIERLYGGEHALSKGLAKAIAARRQDAIPRLIELVEDERLWPTTARGEGWVPIHAVELLGTLGAVEAVPTLIDVIAASEPMEILGDAAIKALETIGAPAALGVLETVKYTRARELKATLASILGKVGHDHPATFDALVAIFDELRWQEERVFAAWGFADLGDPRAIPILQRALHSRGITGQDRIEIEDALAELGAAHAAPSPRPIEAKKPSRRLSRPKGVHIRRTASCWCGSGKQYKDCHMQADAERAKKGKAK